MALNDTIGKLENLLSGLVKDLSKAWKGNKAAAQRMRVGTIRLEKLGKIFRKESVDAEKSCRIKRKRPKKRKRV